MWGVLYIGKIVELQRVKEKKKLENLTSKWNIYTLSSAQYV